MSAEDKYMTVEAVATYLGFSKQTIYDKIHDNRIPYHKIGPKAVRFKRDEIDAWIEQQKEQERYYEKREDKYYLVIKSPPGKYQITSEDELLKETMGEAKASWKHERLPFEFDKEDLKTAKEILKKKIVYPRLIKNNIFVYENFDASKLQQYLTILKLFNNKMKLDVNFLQRLKERFIENVEENFQMPDPDIRERLGDAYVGFFTEEIADELLTKFKEIAVYLEYGKKGPIKKYLAYANRYLDKETFLALYFHGFCYFTKDPFSYDPPNYFLKDKIIGEATPEQIEMGLKEKIFTVEEVSKRIERLEAEVKALKSVVKQNAKGGNKHGSKD